MCCLHFSLRCLFGMLCWAPPIAKLWGGGTVMKLPWLCKIFIRIKIRSHCKQEQHVAPESIISKTTNYSSAVISILLHEPIESRLMCRISSRSWFKLM